MTDVYTALKTAQAAHDAAAARMGELAANLARARAAVRDAAALVENLLADAAAGGDISDADLLAGRDAQKRMEAVEELAAAKHEHAHRQTLQPHADLLAAKRDVAQSE
jgi:hypothetical protein